MQNPFKPARSFLSKHEPQILLGFGIVGLIASTGLGIWGGFRTSKALRKYKEEHNLEKLTPKEVFKISYRYFIPTAISMGASIACLIAGNKVSSFRYAAAVTAYTSSEVALQELKEATKEVVGEKKAKQIQEAVDAKRIEQTYKGGSQIIMTDNGDSLFYEPLSGRYFTSNWNAISKAANELNAVGLKSMSGFITLNEWFNKLGLDDVKLGETMGWDLSRDPGNIIEISISSHIVPKENKPCGAISYKREPDKLKFSAY